MYLDGKGLQACKRHELGRKMHKLSVRHREDLKGEEDENLKGGRIDKA